MNVVWSPTALDQLDEIYEVIASIGNLRIYAALRKR